MGFKEVYKCLIDLFPEVDTRILKAVAIEHPKDADDAAEAVLSEVLPYLSELSMVSDSFLEGHEPAAHDEAECEEESYLMRRRRASSVKANATPEEPRLMLENISSPNFTNPIDNAESRDKVMAPNSTAGSPSAPIMDPSWYQRDIDLTLLKPNSGEEAVQSGSGRDFVPNTPECKNMTKCDQACTDSGNVHSSLEKCQEINTKPGNEKDSGILLSYLLEKNDLWSNSVDHLSGELNKAFGVATCLVQSSTDVKSLEVNDSVIEQTAQDAEFPVAGDLDVVPNSQNASGANMISSEIENSLIEEDQAVDEGALPSDFPEKSRSDCDPKQEIEMEVLEEIIESAKDNKKTLFSAMESVMDMISEVELQERAAEQAKDEAARGGLDILVKVEELKTLLVHAKEANDMHAGEVYGEKAILATEVRELQSRLLSLSDERDKTLAILDEMRQDLETRLAAAREIKEAADQEKLEKEECARNALGEQEAIMEKVVQESEMLQEEAEKNSKLRDFLMDRGRVVDALQGEISVIFKDVRLLKEKFDKRVPLSESFSSSQTSCILASSGSSLKSKVSGIPNESGDTSEDPKETSLSFPIDARSPASRSRQTSPASSNVVVSPRSSTHGQSPKRSPRETSPSSSVNGHLPINRVESNKIVGTRLDDDWDFLDSL